MADKVRVGFIGTGGIAGAHLGNLKGFDDVELAAMCDAASTAIRMRDVPLAEIEAYVATGESFGKAGAYAIQETADAFIAGIDGSFSNVVGLPMELLGEMLTRFQGR